MIACKYEFKLAPIQLTQVAAKAGVSTRTLYRYYPDKDELLYAAAVRFLQRECDVFVSHYAVLDQAGMNGLERLILLLRTQRNYFSNDPIKSVLFSDANNTYVSSVSGQKSAHEVVSKKIMSVVVSCIADGKNDGSIQDGFDPIIICSMVGASFDGIMQYLAHINRAGIESARVAALDAVFDKYIEMLSVYLGGKPFIL